MSISEHSVFVIYIVLLLGLFAWEHFPRTDLSPALAPNASRRAPVSAQLARQRFP